MIYLVGPPEDAELRDLCEEHGVWGFEDYVGHVWGEAETLLEGPQAGYGSQAMVFYTLLGKRYIMIPYNLS